MSGRKRGGLPDMRSGNEFLVMDSPKFCYDGENFSLFCEIANFGSVWICVDSVLLFQCAILIIRDVFHWIVSCSGDAAPVLFVIR